MGKFKPRLKGKGKRWKKGQSSSSNPDIKKHRDVAKSRFFQVQENAGKGNLTSDAIKKHNAFLGEKMEATETTDGDDVSVGGTFKTFQTFASDWSLCSNQSFSKLLLNFRTNSSLDKEMLAVLAAVTEVIKQNGGTESTTEYFGALMTTLEVSETEDSITAVLRLLGMGIKQVPENVLQAKFPEITKRLVELLGKFAETDCSLILVTLLGLLSVVLRVQELAVWSAPSTMQTFDSVLAFTTFSKPKVRKAAQHAVCAILKASKIMKSDNPPIYHPGAPSAANFCVRQIESGGSLGGQTTILHTLGFMKEILGCFPKNLLKTCCELILKVMTLGNVLVTSCGMQALHGLFLNRNVASTMTPALNAQLIAALHEYQPAPNDTQPTLAWLAVMQEAFINLANQDVSLCCLQLPRLFNSASQLWLAEKVEVMGGATRCMLAATEECIGKICATQQLADRHANTLATVLKTVQDGLQYQFHTAWPQVLHLLAVFFEVTGGTCPGLLKPCLKALADLRDSFKFSYSHELENAVCKAIKAMGPEAVLEVIPLQITGQETSYEFSRSWLLPILKEGVQRTSLNYFARYFLPLATACRGRREACAAKNDMIGAHSFDLLQSQIWSLLPSFCDRPTDLVASFKGLARILGSAITECKDLRVSVLAALRRLITSSQEKAEAGDLGDRNEVARFAKNFLPILFNVYTTKTKGSDEEGQRLAAYETIKMYLSISDAALCHELFDKAFLKLESSQSDAFIRESVLDLLRALLHYQDSERINRLYAMCTQGVTETKNTHVQKKAYRMLEEICSSDGPVCRQFITENLVSLQDFLLKTLSKSAISSKGPRLRCLIYVIKRLDSTQLSVLERIIPEAVLCCKDANEKCRAAAFSLLVEVARVMLAQADKPADQVMKDYLGLLLAGLAGSASQSSATILALAKITFDFRDTLDEDMLMLMLENICILSTSSCREIVTSCLSYIKVFITAFTPEEIGPAVPTIVKGMLSMTEDCKRHLRNKYRNIFDRLVKKFGWKPISDLVPQTDVIMHKRLKNLRKQQEKKKKTRDEDMDSDSEHDNFIVKARQKTMEEILAEPDDSDIEAEEPRPSKNKNKNKKSSAWLQEDEDDIIDFTDVSANKNIRATKPGAAAVGQGKVKKPRSEMKTATDGRLIIADDSDSEGERTKPKWRSVSDSESDDEKPSQLGKRKRRDSGGTDAQSESASKYQAGGSGIHRPMRQPKKKKKGPPVSTGDEYKSKKASGDVKRKGRPDPYAYVPMSRKLLNKRVKNKPSGQFKNLVRKGSKAKASKAVKGKKGKKHQ